MDFKLNDEQREFQEKVRRFSAEVIRPIAAAHDRDESVPWEAIKAAREWGLHGLETIQKMGEDPDGIMSCIYAEEMHWGCAGIALAIQGGSLAAAGIASSGTPEQIGRWVPECFGMGDEIKLGAYAVTEPSAGSDVRSLRTTAKLDGDEWVLNGTKVFITNGGIADVTVVVATVDPDLGHRGQASFVVPKGTPGLSQGKKETKLGIRASQTTEVILEDCRVPMDHLLGGYEKLQKKLERARSGTSTGRSSNALATFELTRPLVGASALGIAQAAYEWTLEYLSDKEEDGQPLLQQQRIQQTLADVATEIESARLLVWRAAWMGRSGIPMTAGQGSMSKLKAGDVAMWATTTLMDLVGPFAQTTDCPLEKWFRDAKIYQIFEGTAQVQRLVIARMQAAHYSDAAQDAERPDGVRRLRGRRRHALAAYACGRAPACVAALALVLLAPCGCDSASSEPQPKPPIRSTTYHGRVIRGWLLALERQDYEQAAYYFAPGAIIDQGHPFRLRTREAGAELQREPALPRGADRAEGRGSPGARHLQLHQGPGGGCSGLVKVRYTIREGKFTEWRQLPTSGTSPLLLNPLPLCQAVVPAQLRLALPPLLVARHGFDRRNLGGIALVIEGDHREVGGRGVEHLAAAHVLGLHAHADLHRAAPGGVHRRLHRHELTDEHRVPEGHAVHRRRHDARAGVAHGRDARPPRRRGA